MNDLRASEGGTRRGLLRRVLPENLVLRIVIVVLVIAAILVGLFFLFEAISNLLPANF